MIGERIKFLREQQGMTQAALAKHLGITRASVNSWEMGISVPSTRYLAELSTLFHVSCDFFLGLDSYPTVNVSGLSDEDVMLVAKLASHLRKKNEEQ